MTAAPAWQRVFDRVWFCAAPAERLAALRIFVGLFACAYVLGRFPYLVTYAGFNPKAFSPVGIVAILDRPLVPAAVYAIAAPEKAGLESPGELLTVGVKRQDQSVVLFVVAHEDHPPSQLPASPSPGSSHHQLGTSAFARAGSGTGWSHSYIQYSAPHGVGCLAGASQSGTPFSRASASPSASPSRLTYTQTARRFLGIMGSAYESGAERPEGDSAP
jgi:hypothetical protein